MQQEELLPHVTHQRLCKFPLHLHEIVDNDLPEIPQTWPAPRTRGSPCNDSLNMSASFLSWNSDCETGLQKSILTCQIPRGSGYALPLFLEGLTGRRGWKCCHCTVESYLHFNISLPFCVRPAAEIWLEQINANVGVCVVLWWTIKLSGLFPTSSPMTAGIDSSLPDLNRMQQVQKMKCHLGWHSVSYSFCYRFIVWVADLCSSVLAGHGAL